MFYRELVAFVEMEVSHWRHLVAKGLAEAGPAPD